MHKGYTLNYFIDFFSDIPNTQWTVGQLCDGTKRCAIGLAGNADPETDELRAEARVQALESFLDNRTVAINDCHKEFKSLGNTPRSRILRALRNRKRYGNVFGRQG